MLSTHESNDIVYSDDKINIDEKNIDFKDRFILVSLKSLKNTKDL